MPHDHLMDPMWITALERFRGGLVEALGEEPTILMTFGLPVRSRDDLMDVGLTDYLGWYLQAQHAAVYRWDGKRFICLCAFGKSSVDLGREPFLPQWLLDHGLLIRSRLGLSGLTPDEAEMLLQELDALDAQTVVPVTLNESLWGFIVIGPSVIKTDQDQEREGLRLGLYGLDVFHCLQRKQMGFPTRQEQRFSKEQKSLAEIHELWLSLRPSDTRMKLLVLDQEKEVVSLLKTYFEEWGFEVAGFTSESAAIENLNSFKPHVILVDFSPYGRVPERFLQAARKRLPDAILLGTSTTPDEAVDSRVLSLGITSIFRRPPSLPVLTKEIFEAALAVSFRGNRLSSPEAQRYLIVEDEAEAAHLLQEHLKARGFQVWSALDGHQALDLVNEVQPDVVLLDLKLPGIDGAQLLDKIRRIVPSAKVIVLTGCASEYSEQALEALGVDAFAFKPLPLTELDRLVDQHCSCL